MGNYISCTLAAPLAKSARAARVVLPGGEVRQIRVVVKAAELMLECPNFFVANTKSLHIGRRFSALGADEELEFGNVYTMFPMKRVNSVVTAADMAVFFMAANSASKRIAGPGKMRVSPGSGSTTNEENVKDSEDKQEGPRLTLEGVDEGFPVAEFKLVTCRSRKPLLETIKEEPVFSR